MKRFLERSLFAFSAFAMAACFALTGCTDAVVGHEDGSDTNQTVLLAPDDTPAQHGPSHEENGKLVFHDFQLPPPDSTSNGPLPDSTSSNPPAGSNGNSKLNFREFQLPPPNSTSADSSSSTPADDPDDEDEDGNDES